MGNLLKDWGSQWGERDMAEPTVGWGGGFSFSKAETLSFKIPSKSAPTLPICVGREPDAVPTTQVQTRWPGWVGTALLTPPAQVSRGHPSLGSVFLESPEGALGSSWEARPPNPNFPAVGLPANPPLPSLNLNCLLCEIGTPSPCGRSEGV